MQCWPPPGFEASTPKPFAIISRDYDGICELLTLKMNSPYYTSANWIGLALGILVEVQFGSFHSGAN